MKKIFIFLFFCVLLAGCNSQLLYQDNRAMMGTFVEIISPNKKAASIAFEEIKRIENLLSKYNPESEVSKLNRLGELKVSPETLYILKKSQEFWLASGGAFDITVGPLMDLWGFSDKRYRCPSDKEIQKAIQLVGMDKISFDDRNNVVKFKLQGMKVDLGAIAKGYAVDCALNKLKVAGIKSCLINAGGQISALGDRFGRPWRVAIRSPRGKGFAGYLALKDKAVATSGDYEQCFFSKRKRYAHIFNPKTGYPAQSGVVSVTVIAPEGLTCDALSTAIFVLGKAKGEALAGRFIDTKVMIDERIE